MTREICIIAIVFCSTSLLFATRLSADEETQNTSGENSFFEHVIGNKVVQVSMNAAGELTELTNLRSGWNYAGQRRIWRIFYTQNEVSDNEALAVSDPKITADEKSIKLRYDTLKSLQGETLNICVEIQVLLEGESDDVQWVIVVENNQSGITITEVQFPLVGNIQLQPGQSLILSRLGGKRYFNYKALVRSKHSKYRMPDQKGIRYGVMYPGQSATTNCFVFAANDEGLYFGSHDPSFQGTFHSFLLKGEELQAGFVKYPFLNSGEKFTSAEFVLSSYSGTWHVASKKYRNWANSWFIPPEQPDWVKKMTGWQRIILRHQYGELLHPHSTITELAAIGREAGVDSLLIFGWWKAGMDAEYPRYAFDESQGGRELLAEQIKLAREQGTTVQLYFNGRLIDKDSEYYRSGEASKVSIKDLDGNEWNESYHFGGDGTTTWMFGRKTFVVACSTSQSWQKKRLEWVDKALSVGVDAVFFDQMGQFETPCTDIRHGHPVPLTNAAPIQASFIREVRERVRAKNPEAAFGTEVLNDVMTMQCDYIHTLGGMYDSSGFIEWFRYTYPEIIISDRAIYDDTDIERRVNILLSRGLRSDVDIWRCRGTIADTPNYEAYLGKVNKLRKKYSEFLLEGRYCDTEPIQVDNPGVDARAFQSGNLLMVVSTQSEQNSAEAAIQVSGYQFVSKDGLGDYQCEQKGNTLQVTLKKNAVALAIFEKQ
ncbi:MAG: hypothetical protein JXD22_03480 [Sedimentisphaerales bacterium]|nr:hypothetical protein [Sedimentisphaerales bacterium]